MVISVILIESAFCAPVAVIFQEMKKCLDIFSERRLFWRPCFICRWGRASKKYICDDEMCNVLSTEVLGPFVVVFSLIIQHINGP